MKLIKKAQVKEVALKDRFQVGDVVKFTGTFFDGRGTENYTRKLTVTQVNRVTIDAEDKKGNVYRLDATDLMYTVKLILKTEVVA